MFEDNFFKKFYSIKTKKLLRVLRVKGEIISLGNTILILDSNKAYLYSFRPVCTKL